MEVIKVIRKAYECMNAVDKPFTKFGKFRETRERLGLKVQRRCFKCGHKFKEDEDIYLAMFRGTLNHFLCKNCNDKALSDIQKGGQDGQTAK